MIEVVEMDRRRQVLAELQAEAMEVFAGSGETVETFLWERREEARRESLSAERISDSRSS